MKQTWSLATAQQRRVPLSDENVQDIRREFAKLELVSDDLPYEAECMSCEEKDSAFGAQLSDSKSDNLLLIGSSVYLGSQKRRDNEAGMFKGFYAKLFSQLNVKLKAADDRQVIAALREGDLGDLFWTPCECGGPDDFNAWAYENTYACNSCYNFAVKDRWVSEDANGGAMPESASSELRDWIDAIEDDGLEHVADWKTAPKKNKPSKAGWYVALALDDSEVANGHFLRLDGSYWSHKWSSYPPQLCDFGANADAIPKDGILDADLCEYCVAAFFWCPRPLKLYRP
jgi:hypothetical protein